MEEDEDYESQISIRNTLTDFLEDINCRQEFDKGSLERILGMLASDDFGILGERSQEISNSLSSKTLISDVKADSEVYIPSGYQVLKTELAFFFIG